MISFSLPTPLSSSILDVSENLLQKNTKLALRKKSHVGLSYDLPGVVRQTHLKWTLNIYWQVCLKNDYEKMNTVPGPAALKEEGRIVAKEDNGRPFPEVRVPSRMMNREKQRAVVGAITLPLITEQQAFYFIPKWNTISISLNMYIP